MIRTVEDFREAVAFETYVLDRMLPVTPGDQTRSIDLRQTVPRISHMVIENWCSGVVESITNDLAPLLFGAAWKILDLGVELILNSRSIPADRQKGTEWSISAKQDYARQAAGDFHLFTKERDVWIAFAALYANTSEHRHCLVHRTATIDATSGDSRGNDKAGNAIIDLLREEQKSLARVALLAAEAIASGGLTSRNEDHIKHLLDQLCRHTNQELFGVSRQSIPVTIFVNLDMDEEQRFFVDAASARTKAMAAFPSVLHFDLLMEAPDGSGRAVRAHLEDVPLTATEVDFRNLPTWLSHVHLGTSG